MMIGCMPELRRWTPEHAVPTSIAEELPSCYHLFVKSYRGFAMAEQPPIEEEFQMEILSRNLGVELASDGDGLDFVTTESPQDGGTSYEEVHIRFSAGEALDLLTFLERKRDELQDVVDRYKPVQQYAGTRQGVTNRFTRTTFEHRPMPIPVNNSVLEQPSTPPDTQPSA